MVGIVFYKIIIPEVIALESNNNNNNNNEMTMENLFKKIKEESKYLMLILAVFIAIFKIIFYSENILVLIWAVAAFFLTFTIPGFILCYLWHDKVDFTERFIIGNMIGLISIGILSYNLSVWTGINIKIISWITPLIVTLIYVMIVYLNWKKRKKMNLSLID